MHVPSDSFGGLSPERKAADSLRTLFTFIAARVVLAQLQGSGRGELAAYDQQAYRDLSQHLQQVPLKDGDEWVAQLMRQNSALALRVMEVRAAYASEDFEWDNLQKLAVRDTKAANTRLMRQSAAASLAASFTTDQPGGGDGDGSSSQAQDGADGKQ